MQRYILRDDVILRGNICVGIAKDIFLTANYNVCLIVCNASLVLTMMKINQRRMLNVGTESSSRVCDG